MKVPLSWIKEYLEIRESIHSVSDALTLAGLEVEEIENETTDPILTIGLTPNLGHCMSILGIARELSAIFQRPLKRKKITLVEAADRSPLSIDIQAPQDCLHYATRLVKGVKMGPSPAWLKEKLTACGLRSINVVVDIGNLVMLECGQPLHLFDYAKLPSPQIVVRKSDGKGSMVTLDKIERTMPEGALLICSGHTPVAFAGVMGDLDTGVNEQTCDVLIEAAHFTPQAVRKTSKLLQLRSDSSLRFERGIDPLGLLSALDLCAHLLAEVAGGKIAKGVIEKITHPFAAHQLSFNTQRANQLLGTHLTVREMVLLLERLEIKLLHENGPLLHVQVPSYRNDLKAEIDLVEEVGRLYGYNHIPRKIPRHVSSPITHAPLFLFEERIRTTLASLGLQEWLTCDLISPAQAKLEHEKTLGESAHIHVLHPASIDQSVLRTTLLPGLLQAVKFNLDHQNLSLAAFEVGHVHFKHNEELRSKPVAALILSGKTTPYHYETKSVETDFFALKGYVENLLLSLGIAHPEFVVSHFENFQPGRQALIKINGQAVGALGEVHPGHLRDVGIDQRVYFASCSLDDLMALQKTDLQMKPFSPYPGSERDWTVSLKANVPIGTVLDLIQTIRPASLQDAFLLDLYTSEKLGKDRKNVTFRFFYQESKKTIEYAEVEKAHQQLISALEEKLKDHVG